jgi:hypothetical protein
MAGFTRTLYKSDLDLPQLDDDAELIDVIKAYNRLAKSYNFTNKNLSFQANFNANIQTATLAAGASVDIYHFLGVIPKWRIILKQEGNGVVSDVTSSWTDKKITLLNIRAAEVTVTVLIARE